MENLQEQMPKQLQADINKLAKENAMEKRELMARLEQLERLIPATGTGKQVIAGTNEFGNSY